MSEQALAPVPGGGVPVAPARLIPPLPQAIPILPGQLTAPKRAKRLPTGGILLLVAAVLVAMIWFAIHSANDRTANQIKRIDDDCPTSAQKGQFETGN